MSSQECHLLAEIDFWRDMIEREKSTVSEVALERMHKALALAERKLLMLAPERADPAAPTLAALGTSRLSSRRH
ncbi:hypothetical protein F3N42_09135 [Marinihelvus fidelis]|uniref:Uncharacterized protein n=1 Tax=Marinihelvus fidelis TaxID=2613842 RepID=A0A5N0T957_9GAMM|nr:hypothetical protein [Marinihelvus fidelis]KAA9131472.1 hypothetical protein F3N42_09135 [Marinihelvus fidelis]